MKTIASISAVLAAAGLVWAAQAGPINKTCPVKAGMPAKASITVEYKGSTIGFCCGSCKSKFSNDPEGFAAYYGVPALDLISRAWLGDGY